MGKGSKKSPDIPDIPSPRLSDFIPRLSQFGGLNVSFGNEPIPSTGGGGGGSTGGTSSGSFSQRVIPLDRAGNPRFQRFVLTPGGYALAPNSGVQSAGGGGGGGGGSGGGGGGSGEVFRVTPDQGRIDLVNQIAGSFGAQAAGLQPFINQVEPGFGALTQAGVAAIQNARDKSISDLRGNLQQRKLSGSSFANDSIGRVEREFGQAEAEFRSATKLQELDTSVQLFNQQSALRTQELQTFLNELDTQANVGLALLRGISAEFGASSRAAQQAAVQIGAANAQGSGDFLGSLLGFGASIATKGAGSGFTPFHVGFSV